MSTVERTEKPILFSTPMVQAILEGQKTQTRRVLKPPPDWLPEVTKTERIRPLIFPIGSLGQQCGWPLRPKYEIGSHLWVREAWAQDNNQLSDSRSDTSIAYRADKSGRALDNGIEKAWRPSIHMPRWASRLTLRVKDIRVERLQDISEADAEAEGCNGDEDPRWRPSYYDPDSGGYPSFRNSFEFLWDSINGKREGFSWAANPFVWAISFSVLR